MSKLKIIESQLENAKEELVKLNKDENQLIFDYVEYSLILIRQINECENEITSKCAAPLNLLPCSHHYLGKCTQPLHCNFKVS